MFRLPNSSRLAWLLDYSGDIRTCPRFSHTSHTCVLTSQCVIKSEARHAGSVKGWATYILVSEALDLICLNDHHCIFEHCCNLATMLERILDRSLDLRWLCGSILGLVRATGAMNIDIAITHWQWDQLCSYLGYKIIHNVFLHPLQQYPGPWYWAACRLPYTVSIFQGNATHRIAALHEQYGDVVRIAPDTLSYITSEAWLGTTSTTPLR
jgi:hypothetical protein